MMPKSSELSNKWEINTAKKKTKTKTKKNYGVLHLTICKEIAMNFSNLLQRNMIFDIKRCTYENSKCIYFKKNYIIVFSSWSQMLSNVQICTQNPTRKVVICFFHFLSPFSVLNNVMYFLPLKLEQATSHSCLTVKHKQGN